MKRRNWFKSEDKAELDRDAEAHANEVGIKLNPNKEVTETIKQGLLKNKETKGELYCPCRVVTGNKKKDEDIICPCVFHRREIELEGHCKCFLFVSGNK